MAFVSHTAGQETVSIADLIARATYRAVTGLENLAQSMVEAHSRRRTAEILNSLTDAQLADIGLSRANIDGVARTL